MTDTSPLEAEMAVIELGTIRKLLAAAGIEEPSRAGGVSGWVHNALVELAEARAELARPVIDAAEQILHETDDQDGASS